MKESALKSTVHWNYDPSTPTRPDLRLRTQLSLDPLSEGGGFP
jgi:hypothetical protein